MFTLETFFEHLPEKVDSGQCQGLNCLVQFDITGKGGGTWTLLLKGGNAVTAPGNAEQADVTVRMDATDFTKLVTGNLNGQVAFLTGKLRVTGDMGLAMRLPAILGFA